MLNITVVYIATPEDQLEILLGLLDSMGSVVVPHGSLLVLHSNFE